MLCLSIVFIPFWHRLSAFSEFVKIHSFILSESRIFNCLVSLFYSILFKVCNIFLCLSNVISLTLKWTFYFQMNGVTNGSDPGLALQGLTVQGSNNNNNPDNRPVEDPAQRRGKVLGNLSLFLSLSLTDSLYLTRNMCFAIAVPFCLFY